MRGRERKDRQAGKDQGETERLHATENGFSVILHEAKVAGGLAGRKPGKVRDRKSSRYVLVDRLRQQLGLADRSSRTDD